jgi:hypothetical protein
MSCDNEVLPVCEVFACNIPQVLFRKYFCEGLAPYVQHALRESKKKLEKILHSLIDKCVVIYCCRALYLRKFYQEPSILALKHL